MDVKSLLKHETLGCFEKLIADFVECSSGSVHVKNAENKKYILSNYRNMKSLGFQSVDDLIGLTAHDLVEKDGGLWKTSPGDFIAYWKKREIKMVEEIEHQVLSTQRPMSVQGIYCTVEGLIQFEHVTKIPIPNHTNSKSIAILTLAEELNFQLGLFKLLHLYLQCYSETQAIQKFLNYLKLDTYFFEIPTSKELRLLFVMRRDPRHKYAAKRLCLTLGTIGIYISRLRDKLKIDLYHMLALLRAIPINE